MTLEPLAGLRVVDLYAGSGALGIEALSRGAARVDFVESSAAARRVLQSNLAALELGNRSSVWPHRLPEGLGRLGRVIEEADLILLDPPYGGRDARATLDALATRCALRPRVRVIVEHHAKDDLPDTLGGLYRARQRRYGETVVSTYQVMADGGGPSDEEG